MVAPLPPSDPGAERQPAEATQPAGRSATPTAHKLLTLSPGCTTVAPARAKRGVDGAADPVSSSERDKRGTIPPFRRSEGSARYPPTGCRAWSHRLGQKRGLRTGVAFERAKDAAAAEAALVDWSCAGWQAGWALVHYTTVWRSVCPAVHAVSVMMRDDSCRVPVSCVPLEALLQLAPCSALL